MLNFLIRRVSSFTYLNLTQFLGALNDNVYKLLCVYFCIQIEGIENSHKVLALTGAIFVLPFLLFSSSSGTLADRFSKRNIIFFTKVFELFIMSLAVLAFYFESEWAAYSILFLLATQSAIFGPSKYGILPELVSDNKISQANGIMSSFTFLAIILGTFFASFLMDVFNKNFILASFFCLGIAIIGLITSYCIEYTPPSGSEKKLNARIFYDIYETLKECRKAPSLLSAIVGSAFFLFLGAFMQLNTIPFAVYSLGLSDIQGGYLFLLTAMGIGTGSIIAGKISGKTVELGMVPLAGIGISLMCFLLDIFSAHLMIVVLLVILLGVLGGIFQVPLDSYIQVASPSDSRGQVVAATNFLSFCGVLMASLLIYVQAEVFHLEPDHGFTIMGILSFFVSFSFLKRYFEYVVRLTGMVFSEIYLKMNVVGSEETKEGAVIYFCHHTDWKDTLVILGMQKKRVTFFIQEKKIPSSPFLNKLYNLIKFHLFSSLNDLKTPENLALIEAKLKKGISICVFLKEERLLEEADLLQKNEPFKTLLEQASSEAFIVRITKTEKAVPESFLEKIQKNFHTPATVEIVPLLVQEGPF